MTARPGNAGKLKASKLGGKDGAGCMSKKGPGHTGTSDRVERAGAGERAQKMGKR